ELLEERPVWQATHPLLPGEIGDGESRDFLLDQFVMDIDRALNEAAECFLPAQVKRLDFAPILGKASDELGYTLGVDLPGIELQIPVQRADAFLEPLCILLTLEELAEQIHRVPVDEHAAKIKHRNKRIGHAENSTSEGRLAGLWHEPRQGASAGSL